MNRSGGVLIADLDKANRYDTVFLDVVWCFWC